MSSAVPSPTAARRHTTGPTAGRPAGKHEVARGRTSHARLTARAAVLAVVALILLTLAVAPLRALIDQRSDLAKLEQQAEQLADRNARLEARIDRFTDPTYLEQLARECLGMVRPGETAFVMVPTRGAPPSPSC
jgi:cell division protein FtsB